MQARAGTLYVDLQPMMGLRLEGGLFTFLHCQDPSFSSSRGEWYRLDDLADWTMCGSSCTWLSSVVACPTPEAVH